MSVLHDRLRDNIESRPLLGAVVGDMESRLSQLLDERRDAYLDVDFVIDTSDLSVADVVASIFRMYEIREAS